MTTTEAERAEGGTYPCETTATTSDENSPVASQKKWAEETPSSSNAEKSTKRREPSPSEEPAVQKRAKVDSTPPPTSSTDAADSATASTSNAQQSSSYDSNASHTPIGPVPDKSVQPFNTTTLWIGDLERWEDEECVYQFFDQLFPKSVVSVKIARDREVQQSLGYGFIDFVSKEVAEHVLNTASSMRRPHGRRFKLTWAKGKTRQPFNPSRRPMPPRMGAYGIPPAVAGPSPMIAPPSRWVIDIPGCVLPPSKITELVLKPLLLECFAQVENLASTTGSALVRIVFYNHNAFFAFVNRYPDGTFNILDVAYPYIVSPDTMEKWTRMYEHMHARKEPSSQSSSYIRF